VLGRLNCLLVLLCDSWFVSRHGYRSTRKLPPCQEFLLFVNITQVGKADLCITGSVDQKGMIQRCGDTRLVWLIVRAEQLSFYCWSALSGILYNTWVLLMGTYRHGQGEGALAPPPFLEMLKSVFLLQMLSKTSVDKVFMHHFEKMSSASGGFIPRPPLGGCPWIMLGDFCPSDSLIVYPWKKSCGLPWC